VARTRAFYDRMPRLSAGPPEGGHYDRIRLKADATYNPAEAGLYTQFSRILVPLIFWLLSVARKFGISLSISSKYDESAGVWRLAS
jgi:hypothetical protein